jgi:probable F420-dependent oxidoreductase
MAGAPTPTVAFTAQLLSAPSGSSWRALCRELEQLGYAGISVSDHFGAQFAPTIAMAAAASVTERVTLGFNVLANDFRHPAMLAKELATLDVLSDGRVLAGLGAGWMHADYVATGLPFDKASVRIDRLIEAVAVLRGLWVGEPFSFAGAHYRIDSLVNRPLPVQVGGPPLLLGGGAKRMLTTAGASADVVGIALDNRSGVSGAPAASASATAASTRDKLGWIRAGAAAAGRPAPPVSVRVLTVQVTDDRWRAATELGRPLGLDAASLLESPHALVGTAAQIVDDLLARHAEYGFDRYVVSQSAVHDLAPVVAALAGPAIVR